MGAFTNSYSRKRSDRDYLTSITRTTQFPSIRRNFEVQASKKAKISPLKPVTPDHDAYSSSSLSWRLCQYPTVNQPINRPVHAPCRRDRFGFSAKKEVLNSATVEKMGNLIGGEKIGDYLGRKYEGAKKAAFSSLRFFSGNEDIIDVDEEGGRGENGNVRVDSDVVEIVEDGAVEEEGRLEKEGILAKFNELDARASANEEYPSSSSVAVSGLTSGKMLERMPLRREVEDLDTDVHVPVHKKLLESAKKRDGKLSDLDFEIKLRVKMLVGLRLRTPAKKKEDEVIEPFVPLSKDEEAEVIRALSNASRRKVLVTHENSNIQITGEMLQCLKPRAWLNDEVINVYLELLKEREKREPKKFLKCHFFNTFFYKKLISGRTGYDYKSVRRWTTQRKLGYCLFDCDKIFVPVHKEVHWCLAVINKKDGMFQYLDSLGGVDVQVMKVLAKYFTDEVKDKSNRDIDVTSWKKEYVEDLPNQENGYDCGMFMIKYADFYSRDIGLCFKQEHMPYFRMRTAKEILRLRAD